jgi:hypothetical protein
MKLLIFGLLKKPSNVIQLSIGNSCKNFSNIALYSLFFSTNLVSTIRMERGDMGMGLKDIGFHLKWTAAKHPTSAFYWCSVLMVTSLLEFGTCEGAVDGELYYNFIKDKVVPECTPFPGPRSILIMDNAKIHIGEVRISVKLEVVLIIQEIY